MLHRSVSSNTLLFLFFFFFFFFIFFFFFFFFFFFVFFFFFFLFFFYNFLVVLLLLLPLLLLLSPLLSSSSPSSLSSSSRYKIKQLISAKIYATMTNFCQILVEEPEGMRRMQPTFSLLHSFNNDFNKGYTIISIYHLGNGMPASVL